MNRRFLAGILCIIASAVFWGTLPPLTRLLYARGETPMRISAIRSYMTAGIVLLYFLLSRRYRKIRPADIPYFMIYGFAAIGGSVILYASAIKMLPTAMASILVYTAPAFVIILSRIFFKEAVPAVKAVSMIMTFIGCALVVRIWDVGLLKANVAGIAVGLAAGITTSLITVLNRPVAGRYDGRTIAGLILFFGALVFIVINPPWSIGAVPLKTAGVYLLLTVFASLLPFALYLTGIGLGVEGGTACITSTLDPVVATVLCVMFFHERLDAAQMAGMTVVVGGISLPFIWKRGGGGRNRAGGGRLWPAQLLSTENWPLHPVI